jgi:hypothetical protein
MQLSNLEVRNLYSFAVCTKLGNRVQYEASLPITYRLAHQVDISFVGMYSYREIGESSKQKIGSTTFFEPSSQAQELGARLEFGYLF